MKGDHFNDGIAMAQLSIPEGAKGTSPFNMRRWPMTGLGHSGHFERGRHVRFSNRPFSVKHFQTIRRCGVDVAHGLVLLGMAPRPLYGAFLVKRFEQGGASFFIVCFFVRSESPFLRPDPCFVHAGAPKSGQGSPSHQPCGMHRPCQ